MWIKEKPLYHHSEKYKFIYPNKIDYINLIHYEHARGKISLFYIGIDGKKYVSLQDLYETPPRGYCVLVDPSEERSGYYLCDDSVIIAAICRFLFVDDHKCEYHKPGYSLPLLSRELSRKFLAWHQIPHPVGEETTT